jgi:sulfur-carrier protein
VIRIELPKALGVNLDGKSVVELEDSHSTIADAFASLGKRSPGVLDRVMDERGEIRPHVNVFLDGESIRFLDGLDTPVHNGSTIIILAAISGG